MLYVVLCACRTLEHSQAALALASEVTRLCSKVITHSVNHVYLAAGTTCHPCVRCSTGSHCRVQHRGASPSSTRSSKSVSPVGCSSARSACMDVNSVEPPAGCVRCGPHDYTQDPSDAERVVVCGTLLSVVLALYAHVVMTCDVDSQKPLWITRWDERWLEQTLP